VKTPKFFKQVSVSKIPGNTAAQDDHIPFAAEGIPVVDLIDLDYAYWHRSEDTTDKLSAENMSIVGDVVLASLPEIAKRLDTDD